MKTHPATLILGISLACQVPAFAADSTTSNLLMTATTFTANSNLGAPNGSTPSNVADGKTSTVFTFGDTYSGQNPNPGLLSISGLKTPNGIDSLTFFDYPTFTQRTASQVTIYTATTNTAGSLTTSDYTLLGTFTLPTNGQSSYTEGMDSAPRSTSNFDTLSGLGIAADTQSLLLAFPSSNAGYGDAFSEIQAFGTVPEPGTWAMVAMSSILGAFVLRRRQARSVEIR